MKYYIENSVLCPCAIYQDDTKAAKILMVNKNLVQVLGLNSSGMTVWDGSPLFTNLKLCWRKEIEQNLFAQILYFSSFKHFMAHKYALTSSPDVFKKGLCY